MPEPVHSALYTKPTSVSVGPVNCFRQICCGIVPAVSSRADYQNPEPEKAENPFIEERQLMVMSFSDPDEYNYILFSVKGIQTDEDKKSSVKQSLCEHLLSFQFPNSIS